MEHLAFSGGLPLPASEDRPRAATLPADLDSLAFRALVAFTIVLFVRPQDLLPFLEPFHLADVTGIFAVVALIAGRMGRGAPISRLSFELMAVVALGATMLATAPFSIWPGGSVGVFTDLFSKVIVVFALLINTVTTRARFEKLVNVVVLSTSYVAVRAVIDYGKGVNVIEDGRVHGGGGLFGNPNDMALNMVAFLPLAVALALRLNGGKRWLRLVALIGVPALGAAIVFSKSRAGTIGLVAMLFVLIYQMRRLRPGVAAVVIVAALASVPLLPQSFTDRMSSIFNPEEDPTGSREARKRLLRDGYRAFLENPVVGLGAGQFQNYRPEVREEPWRETHNAVLQVAAEMGTPGLVIFLIIIGSGFAAALRACAILRRVRRRRRPREPDPGRFHREPLELYAAALIASLAGWFVAAMFASVAYYWTLYLVLGLAATLRDIAVRHVSAATAAAASKGSTLAA
jgi:O-antigen ligase